MLQCPPSVLIDVKTFRYYIYSNNCLIIKQVTIMPWGGDLLYKSDRDAQRKIKIKPLGEANVGVAQGQTDPKGDHTKTDI